MQRTNSALEGMHEHLKRLNASSPTIGPKLAAAKIMEFSDTWNIMRAIQHLGRTNYYHFETQEQLRIRRVGEVLGLNLYSDLVDISHFKDTGEQFFIAPRAKPASVVNGNGAAASSSAAGADVPTVPTVQDAVQVFIFIDFLLSRNYS